jgi:prepilin-type N-terminal cleavage/methylation domain-containing protein
MKTRTRQGGFTLVEMMTVVAIIGVMVTMAIVYLKPKKRTMDVANSVGDMMREANRRAVALGPVRPGVAAALGSKARTRIRATGTYFSTATFILERLVEDPGLATTASWVEISRYTTPSTVVILWWNNNTSPYWWNGWSFDPNAFVGACYPDGTCDPRAVSFYYYNTVNPWEHPDIGGSQGAKVWLMPLGGSVRISNTIW